MRKFLWPAVAAGLLAGCVTDGGGAPTTTTGSETVSMTATALSAPRSPFGVDMGVGDLDLPDARTYLRGILTRLAATLPANAPHPYSVDVFVTADGFGGKATVAGDILIGFDVLNTARDEDSIAFLLAHELAHLHQDHLSEERESSALDSISRRLVAALLAGQSIIKKVEESGIPIETADLAELEDAMAALTAAIEGLQVVQSGILAPAYNREQEMQADAAAVQMLIDAEYNPYAAFTVLDGMEEAQQKLAEKTAQAIRTASNSARVIFKIGRKYSDGFGSFMPFDPTDIVFDVATAAAVKFFCEFAETHPRTAARKEQVKEILAGRTEEEFPTYEDDWLIVERPGDRSFTRKQDALRLARAYRDRLDGLLADADPLRAKTGCGEAQSAELERSLQQAGDRIATGMTGEEAAEPEKVDISGPLAELGQELLGALREQRLEGNTSVPHLWAVFADVRAAQAEFGPQEEAAKFRTDAAENLQLGLDRGTEAKALLYRELVASAALAGNLDKARGAMDNLESKFEADWLRDVVLKKAVLGQDAQAALAAGAQCALTTNYFVQERCLYVTVKYRDEIEALELDPDTLTRGAADKSWWEQLRS